MMTRSFAQWLWIPQNKPHALTLKPNHYFQPSK